MNVKYHNFPVKFYFSVLNSLKSKLLKRNTQQVDSYNFLSCSNDLKIRTLEYLSRLQVYQRGVFLGYRHSLSTKKPVLYATISALLIKHIYGVFDDFTSKEIQIVLKHQCDDGLFRDPVIICPEAESKEWWGWRHLTLHALMVLGLYKIVATKEIFYIERYKADNSFRKYLHSLNWSTRAAWTSNEVQNVGVMLQYARDFHDCRNSASKIDIMFDVLDDRQDPSTGLYGSSFQTPIELSLGVQAAYHFWLLYFYDQRPIRHVERIIDNLLKTQNILGGYGVQWHSSACEDIDSIDPLVRFSRMTDYRADDIQLSLQKALPAILQNLNADGGWVFRRHEALTIVHPQMFSATNESNLFYTWFRILGLAYCLMGLDVVPEALRHDWNFGRAPGHQFL